MDPSSGQRSEEEHRRFVSQPGLAFKSAARKTDVPANVRQVQHRPPPPEQPTGSTSATRKKTSSNLNARVPGGRPPVRFAEASRPLNPPPGQLRATKQASFQARPPAPRPSGAFDDAPRKLSRKSASVVPTSQKPPQSSFNYTAPLVRGRATAPTKSTPRKPMFLALGEAALASAAKPDSWDEPAVPRSAPRISAAAMSVQRRAGVSPRKVVVGGEDSSVRRKEAPRLQPIRMEEEESSSSSEATDNDDMPPRIRFSRQIGPGRLVDLRQTGVKAARKTPAPTLAARKRGLASNDEAIEIEDSDEDIDDLLDAFDALTLGQLRLQQGRRLPFLRHNLWAGFEERCARAGVRTHPAEKPQRPVKVVYRYFPDGRDDDEASSDEEQEYQEWVGSMVEWCCPLCQLHNTFKTRDMLSFHLRRDHQQVKVSWTQTGPEDARDWCIKLVLPDYDELESSSEDEDENEDEDEESSSNLEPVKDELEVEDAVLREPSMDATPSPSAPRPREPLFLPDSDDEESLLATTVPELPKAEEVQPKVQYMDSVPPEITRPDISATPDMNRDNRTTTPIAAVTSYRGSLPLRYPSPPPPTDPLGPAAQYLFLPQTNADGQEVYSCRIGGPRIYDLLNELSLDEFGLMSWAIVDREEELFEMDDVRDEDKVMLALWNRYIMLHKTAFIFHDYFEGVKSFLDKYWEFIHKAAGWRALRAFLLMLNVNKYLPFTKVIDALKYYESKTGMALWYKEGGEAST